MHSALLNPKPPASPDVNEVRTDTCPTFARDICPQIQNPKSKIKNPPAAWDTLGMALGHPMGRLKSSMFVGLGTVVRPIYPPATRKEIQPPVQASVPTIE